MMQNINIGFIGAGNMTRCLVSGLIANEYSPKHLWASNPTQQKLKNLENEFGIHCSVNNLDVAKHADILVLAVKPQNIKAACAELKDIVQQKKPLIISIITGVVEAHLNEWLGGELAIVRCMPNIAALVNSSATAAYANKLVSPAQHDFAEIILHSAGINLWVQNEELLNVIAGLSGSGPAYFFLVMEALEDAAVKHGLPREDAHLLVLQTALGAARLALSMNEPLNELRQRVTSKGGITERALNVFEGANIREIFANALKAAKERSEELARQ